MGLRNSVSTSSPSSSGFLSSESMHKGTQRPLEVLQRAMATLDAGTSAAQAVPTSAGIGTSAQLSPSIVENR